jgi:hypothetical protein
MTLLHEIENSIFEIEGINSSIDGIDSIYKSYWINKYNGNHTVSEFRARFNKRYPELTIVLFDGLGRDANGHYLLKNLRATYEFTWIKENYEETMYWCYEIMDDKDKEIENLTSEIIQLKGINPEPIIIDPYEILGINEKESNDDIRKAYRKKISGFHPDRIDKMDTLLKKFATEKTQEINAAFDEIKKSRNIDDTTVD